ncbi:MAG: PilC/PilY family type IV pilus protein, partial [Thiohalocapsa sp.]
VYVGANDGMLHAFAAVDGAELFAYVPESAYADLSDLTDPTYGAGTPKRAFVDGPLAWADAKFTDTRDNAGWKTVLVGSFGLGAQGVYALNITDPAAISEATPADLPLWEFNDSSGSDDDDGALDGRDMGYSLAPPAIVRIDGDLADSSEPVWVALVSNGYNNTNEVGEVAGYCRDGDRNTNCTVSQTGNAVLYVLRMGDANAKRILGKMDTGQGFCQDRRVTGATPRSGSTCPASEQGRTNALGPVTAVDVDGDLIADMAYAGDLFGNLWRFDLVDIKNSPSLLFRSVDGAGSPQSITSKVVVKRHPTGIGTIVLFGTGQYLNAADKSDTQVQSFYGIWDDHGQVFMGADGGFDVPSRTGGDLRMQQFGAEATVNDAGGALASLGRTSSDNPIDWSADGHRGWYIDLKLADGDAEGERVVIAPDVRGNRVVFVSMIPEACCSSGGVSWITALDANDGSRLTFSPFDYDLDGGFDTGDLLDAGEDVPAVPGSSIRMLTDGGTGIYSAPTQLGLGGGKMQSIVSDSEGDLFRLRESTALDWRNWLQLQ